MSGIPGFSEYMEEQDQPGIPGFSEFASEPEPSLETTLGRASQVKPDQHADIVRMADKFGVPSDLVKDNEDYFRSLDGSSSINTERLRSETPSLAEWLKNPDNAALAQDDLDTLKEIEDTESMSLDWLTSSFENMGAEVMENAKQRLRGTLLAGVEAKPGIPIPGLGFLSSPYDLGKAIGDKLGDMVWGEEGSPIETTIDTAKQAAIDALMEEIKSGELNIRDLQPEDLSLTQQGLRSGVTSVIDTLGGLALSLAAKSAVPMLGEAYWASAATSYASGRAEGLDADQAADFANRQGMIELVTELAPTKALVKMFGDKKSFGASLREFVFSDVVGEQFATALQTLNEYAYGLDEQIANAKSAGEVFELQIERQYVTLVASVVGSGIQAGGVKAVDVATRPFRKASYDEASNVAQSHVEAEQMDRLVTLAQASRTNERAQAHFKKFMDGLSPDAEIYLDAESIAELQESEVVIPESVAEQLEGDNADVVISLSEYLSNPEFAAATKDLARRAPERKSARELKKDPAGTMRSISEAARKNLKDFDVVEKAVGEWTQQLADTGRLTQQEAKDSVALWEAKIGTMMVEHGLTAEKAVGYFRTKIMGADMAKEAQARRSEPGKILTKPDFGDLEISEELEVDGEIITSTQKAQQVWDQTSKRRNVLDQLRECIGG